MCRRNKKEKALTEKRKKKFCILNVIQNNKFEMVSTFVAGTLIMMILIYIDFYKEFSKYIEMLNNLYICIIGSLFAAIGFSLSGIAIISSLFTKQDIITIEKYNKKEDIRILLGYYFTLSKNMGLNIVLMISFYFVINCGKSKLSILPFWIMTVISLFFTLYNMFYMISLVKNCIKLYYIKNMYTDIGNFERNLIDDANEIRIDIIFAYLMKEHNIKIEEIIKLIEDSIEESEYENKDEILKYIKNSYGKQS